MRLRSLRHSHCAYHAYTVTILDQAICAQQFDADMAAIAPIAYVAPKEMLQKRAQNVKHVLDTNTWFRIVCSTNGGAMMPKGPDPTDATLTKRGWENEFSAWRWDVRRVALAIIDSPVQDS